MTDLDNMLLMLAHSSDDDDNQFEGFSVEKDMLLFILNTKSMCGSYELKICFDPKNKSFKFIDVDPIKSSNKRDEQEGE